MQSMSNEFCWARPAATSRQLIIGTETAQKSCNDMQQTAGGTQIGNVAPSYVIDSTTLTAN